LAAFAPQTDTSRKEWFYNPKDRCIEGIRLTHQPSPWIGDFAHFTFLPQSEEPRVSVDARWSGMRHEESVLAPYYMQITPLRYRSTIELVPTDSGAIFKLHYGDTVKVPLFAITPDAFNGEILVDFKKRQVRGYTTSRNGRPQREMRCYFVFAFDSEFTKSYVTDGERATEGTSYQGIAAGANVAFSSHEVEGRLAISYLSYEQAEYNLQKDCKGSFEDCKEFAKNVWKQVLDLIEVSGNAEMEKTFYSCLYRAFLYPAKFYEVDKNGKTWHVVGETGEVKEGVMYTNNGFWDTFRTVYPLYSLIAPDLCKEILQGWLNFYDDTGYLPRWASAGTEAACMPGTLIEAVLADAVVKDILPKKDCERALQAMLKNAEVPSQNHAQGRKCVHEYAQMGYVPYDLCGESVNETLDCAYGDFCIAQVAAYLGKKELAVKYYQRSKNYKNLFDSRVGFMRAKDSKGNFRPDFDEHAWGRDYTESSAWQASTAVQHDMQGLVDLYGGKDAFLKHIDALNAQKPLYAIGGYGGEIHEMTEMAAVDFGQCAISNQPSFHIPFIYAELGEREKSVVLVRSIVKELFTAQDDGFPGDEDNGTMASWYLFATMGFYPFCPSKAEYVVTAPLFDKVVLHTKTGQKDVVKLLQGKTKIDHSDFIKK
jgi:predicted alpha-1,2-mannosidase